MKIELVDDIKACKVYKLNYRGRHKSISSADRFVYITETWQDEFPGHLYIRLYPMHNPNYESIITAHQLFQNNYVELVEDNES